MSEAIIQRIQKLLALAESPNEHEAALAAEKAQEMMLRHGIDIATVAMAENGTIGVGGSTVDGRVDPWRRRLAGAVAHCMDGRVVYEHHDRSKGRITFYGQRETVQGMTALYRYLEAQLVAISAIATAQRAECWVHGRTWRTSFLLGAVRRLSARLSERYEAMSSEGDNKLALVVVKKAVDRYVDQILPDLGRDSYRPSVDPAAYAEGHRAGGELDLGDERIQNDKPALPIGASAL